jgi:hypothetical protein
MRWRFIGTGVLVAGLAVGSSSGQQPGSAVQLPTISSFGTNTTVTVPDRGSAYLGGINRAASGRNEFGVPLLKGLPLFRNRGIGMERSSASTNVSVYIHDFDAMDEYLLGQPARRFAQSYQPTRGTFAARAARDTGARPPEAQQPVPAGPAAMSVAELRTMHRREEEETAQKALEFFERGKKAETAGKLNVARIYYQMAARRAADPLKSQIAARLELIESTKVAKDEG